MITQAMCAVAKRDWMLGVHQPGDDYRLALYDDTANLGASTTAYTATGEVTGDGYTAGGIALSGFDVSLVGTEARMTFTSPTLDPATITARGGLVYNASRSNKALAVVDFGGNVSSTNAAFEVAIPPDLMAIG